MICCIRISALHQHIDWVVTVTWTPQLIVGDPARGSADGEEESLQDKYFHGNILMAHFYCNLNDSPESFKVGETSAFNLGKLSIFSFLAGH